MLLHDCVWIVVYLIYLQKEEMLIGTCHKNRNASLDRSIHEGVWDLTVWCSFHRWVRAVNVYKWLNENHTILSLGTSKMLSSWIMWYAYKCYHLDLRKFSEVLIHFNVLRCLPPSCAFHKVSLEFKFTLWVKSLEFGISLYSLVENK